MKKNICEVLKAKLEIQVGWKIKFLLYSVVNKVNKRHRTPH